MFMKVVKQGFSQKNVLSENIEGFHLFFTMLYFLGDFRPPPLPAENLRGFGSPALAVSLGGSPHLNSDFMSQIYPYGTLFRHAYSLRILK